MPSTLVLWGPASFNCKVRDLDQNNFSFPVCSNNLRWSPLFRKLLLYFRLNLRSLPGKAIEQGLLTWVGTLPLWWQIRELWSSLLDNPASSAPVMTNGFVWWQCQDSAMGEASFRPGSISKGESMDSAACLQCVCSHWLKKKKNEFFPSKTGKHIFPALLLNWVLLSAGCSWQQKLCLWTSRVVLEGIMGWCWYLFLISI